MIRVVFTKVVDGQVRTFSASGREGETFDAREFMQHYGFASMPQEGAAGVIVYNGNHIIAIASDDARCRPELKGGESVIFDDLGQKVHLSRDGIVAESPKRITATAPEINLGGDRDELLALIDERILELLNAHVHPIAGGGVTEAMAIPITAEMVCTTKTKAS